MNLILDSHAHYDDPSFDIDRNELLENLNKKGILAVINCSADLETAQKSLNLSRKYDFIYSSIGVHPLNIENISKNYLTEIKKMVNNEKVVAIGEIGLDYHYNSKNKEFQKKIFKEQLELAEEFNLPVIVHDRETGLDVINLLENYNLKKSVIHCFSGDLQVLEKILKLNMYIGVGGTLTFKNNVNLVNVIKKFPLERILLETDAPYLAPVPFRGKRCDSSMIIYTAQKLSEIKEININKLLEIIKNNFCEFFNIKV